MTIRPPSLNTRLMFAIAAITAIMSGWRLLSPVTALERSARLGTVRGQLWLDDINATANDKEHVAKDTELAIRHALKASPANSAAWLALALATERNDWIDRRASAALKMSYYTGFNMRAMIFPRLELSARIDLGRDTELRELLKRQLRAIVTRAPDLKPAIATAYANSTEVNREFIESELADLDPTYLGTLRNAR